MICAWPDKLVWEPSNLFIIFADAGPIRGLDLSFSTEIVAISLPALLYDAVEQLYVCSMPFSLVLSW